MDDYTAFRFLWFSLVTLSQVLQAQWPLTPGVNTNAVHKWVYISERKSICKMHIFYIILYVLIFNMCGKWEFCVLGPCTHLNRTVLSMLQHKMPNFSRKSHVPKRSAWTGYSTIKLYSNKIQICCFFLIIYLFILCANERLTFCTLGPIHVKESLLLS